MSDSLTLARRLSALDDDALASLLTARQVAGSPLRDFFDLADALLQPASIRLALRPFSRETLQGLASDVPLTAGVEPELATLVELELVAPQPDSVAYATVRAAAEQVLVEAEPAPTSSAPPVSSTSTPSSPDARAGEHAFGALVAVSELGHQLRSAPLRLRARGGVSAADEKRLAPLLSIEQDAVTCVVEVATAAGLVVSDGDTLCSTEAADDWSLRAAPRRWLALASAWFRGLDAPVRRTLRSGRPEWIAGAALVQAFRSRHPAADDAMLARLAEVDTVAEFLGLTAGGAGTDLGSLVLDLESADHATTGAGSAALTALEGILPPEVSQVYVQHDLSIIAPGPLAPGIDARLRRLAGLENRGVASSYRVTQQSIDRALAEGETAEGVREFLTAISLTGIPQSLDYLISEGGRRHGLVQVRRVPEDADAAEAAWSQPAGTPAPTAPAASTPAPTSPAAPISAAPSTSAAPTTPPAQPAPPTPEQQSVRDDQLRAALRHSHSASRDTSHAFRGPARTRILSSDPALTGTIAVDQALSSLALVRETDGSLTSRVDPSVVYWTLIDARYPVIAEDADGTQIVLRRTRIARAPRRPSPAVAASVTDIIRRLRAAPASGPDDDTAWLTRQLDQAVRARTPLAIDVRLPDGRVQRYDVTPLSIANGRLRCVDTRAGVERTVPVANIVQLATG